MWLSEEDLHRNVHCPISHGSLPCSDVELPRSIDKLVSSPILDGIVPTIDTYSTNNSFKCVSLPKSVGIVPIMLLEESAIIAVSFENEGI
jgi:hypothetical protein